MAHTPRTKSLITILIGLSALNFTFAVPAQAISKFDAKAVVDDTTLHDETSYSEPTQDCTADGGNVAITGDNVKDAFVFFTGKGLKDYMAAAIIGNLRQESTERLDPTINEDRVKRTIPKDGVGFGIAQWTFAVRQDPLVALANRLGKPPTDLGVQLQFVWQELNTTEKPALTALRKSTDVVSATIAFEKTFERCRSSRCEENTRTSFASEVLELARSEHWSGAGAPTTSPAGGCTSTGSAGGGAIVKIALAEVGTAEVPMGSNRGPACKYQGSACGEAWCADFVSWVYKQAGVPLTGGTDGGWRIAGAEANAGWFKKNGIWINNPGKAVPVGDPRAPKPGDVVLYPSGDSYHVNLVVSYDGKTVKTVGGNQGPGAVTTGARDVFGTAVGWGRLK